MYYNIDHNFRHHSASNIQLEKYQKIRDGAKDLAILIDKLCPDSRERSLAFTNLEQVVMWANASIARNT